MGSNHPWKSKIQSSLGNTPAQRASCLKDHYDKVRLVRGSAYWTGNKGYNLERSVRQTVNYPTEHQVGVNDPMSTRETIKGCPFCNLPADRVLKEYRNFLVIRDFYPVTLLHTLIISKEHKKTYFDLSAAEANELHEILHEQKALIESEDFSVEGFNIGANVNEVSGQTVPHFHLHLIPRRAGDMDDPKGGVRGVIPEKQKY